RKEERTMQGPQAGLHVWPTSTCLLSQLCEELVRCHNDDLHEVIVILPTQRQITYFLALLAEKKRAFRPPQLLTLDPFISNLADAADDGGGDEALAVASELLQELLLAAMIREKNYRHLQLG